MREQLLKLAKVQTFDKTLYNLEQELKRVPTRLAELDEEQKSLAVASQRADQDFDEVTAQKEALEKDNGEITARLRKAEQRLMNSKTQKEYQAANAEIEDGKDSLKANEDLLLEVMEKFEAAKAKKDELAEKLKAFVDEADQERGRLDERSQSVQKEMDGLSGKRGELVKDVDPPLLHQYDFIRKRSRGVALAGVRDGSCLVCHVDLPPQQYMELQRMDTMIFCPSCSRLLYWADCEGFENC